MQVSAAAGALAARLRIRSLLGCKRGVTCRYRLQPEVVLLREVEGDQAEQLAAELPGLVTVQGSSASRKAAVADARQHEKLLEKVICCSTLTDIPGLGQSGSSIKEFAPRWEAIVPPSCEYLDIDKDKDISAEAHSLSKPGPLRLEYCFQCIALARIFLKAPFQQGIEMMLSSRA